MTLKGGHFPDEKQTLLLQAALSGRLAAIRHFVNWLSVHKLDELNLSSGTFLSDFMDSIDKGSQRMLPLVIHNLGENTHPYFKFLTGTRKNYWVKNKQTAHKATELLKILAQAHIPAMLIKGLDLAENYYENTGHRPVNNGDILIPFIYWEQAIELAKKGVLGNKGIRYGLEPKGITHVLHLEFENQVRIDVYWSIFREYAHIPDASDFIWQGAINETRAGNTYYRMSATHALFISLVSGRGFEFIPPFRWVADAKMIVGKSDIDWDEFLKLAKTFSYKPFLKKAVRYLIDQHKIGIPADFAEKLNKLEASKPEEDYYLAISGNRYKYGLLINGFKRRVSQYNLFLKDTDISLAGYLFSWAFNQIKARLAK
jgi:hypothetical protein